MRRYWPLPALAIVAIVTLIYWSARSAPAERAGSPRKVTFQLQWTPGGQFIGFYAARALNYFAEEGLEVEFLHGGPDVNTVSQVANGTAQLGLAPGDQVLVWSAANTDARVALKVLGTVFGDSLARFMSHEDNALRTPQDLVGKRVGVFPNYDTDNLLRVLLHRHRIPADSLTILDFPSLAQFDQRTIDAYPSYVINEPVLQRLRGNSVHLLNPEDFGVHFYSDTIITTTVFHRDNRETLVRFIRAASRGWRLAEQDFEEAAAAMASEIRPAIGSGAPWEHQEAAAREAVSHLHGGPRHLIFGMDANRWEEMQGALHEIGRLSHKVDIGALCDFDIVERAEQP
jgi:ABC-type nitrate/sulfonate/bicarbonate transport system substrate-binding protein